MFIKITSLVRQEHNENIRTEVRMIESQEYILNTDHIVKMYLYDAIEGGLVLAHCVKIIMAAGDPIFVSIPVANRISRSLNMDIDWS